MVSRRLGSRGGFLHLNRYAHRVSRYRLVSEPHIEIEVITAGLACCTLEVEAAVVSGQMELVAGDQASPTPAVVVIAGTVTDALLPSVRAVIDAHPEAKLMSFGACATSGGPYWDSPPVTKGIDQFADVHLYVAGCPPRPEALTQALKELVELP
jgi:NADH-quinone oxidoreductase subunit B